eukprot:263762_1
MSFSMHQWKSDDEKDGKWSSNYMHFSYLQNDELWVEFDIPNTLLMIPKKWTEVATTPIIHNEMVSYHNKYKKNVPIWIWNNYQKSLKSIEVPMSYGVNDIGVINGQFVEIFSVEGSGPIYKCKILDDIGVIMKGSQKKRDEIKTKIRKEKQKATRAAKGNKKTK